MLDVKDLRYFVAVYERQGFCRAAVALHTSQSNVSLRVRRLEETIGAALFERMHRRIAPTPKGELLYQYAVGVLTQLEDLEGTIKGDRAA